MTLEQLIQTALAARGALSVADYMALCLAHPQYGYYVRRDPLGATGDFTTSPEISQIFGELVGIFMAGYWLQIDAPAATLAEMGPGRGTLMADCLRATARVPGFHDAMDVQMVEISPTLTARQRETLNGAHPRISWQAMLQLPPKPLFLIANEFFDALPIRQFNAAGEERMVVLKNGRLAFSFADEEVATETCEPAMALTAIISRHIAHYGGCALFIDYGYRGGSKGDSLQALKAHQFHDPLVTPGEADLTAHVDFDALAAAARVAGALAHNSITQGEFLTRMGAGLRAQKLCERATPEQKLAIIAAVERLISIDKMGDLFKCLCITQKDAPAPEGF